LKKEDLHIQVEDDRILYISHSSQPKEEAARDGDAAAAASSSQSKEQPPSNFIRKFKLPETVDVKEIKAEVTNETLTVTVPKRKTKSPEARKIDVSDGAVAAAPAAIPSTSTA